METALEIVTRRVFQNGNPEVRTTLTPLLTLEEFFEGNDCIGSIGCNLDSEPTPLDFYKVLLSMRARFDVSDIRIQITAVDHPGDEWPFFDTVWIFTSCDAETVLSWFPASLSPDEAWEGFIAGGKYEPVEIVHGHQPIAAWFD